MKSTPSSKLNSNQDNTLNELFQSDWLQKNSKNILFGIALAILLLILAGRYFFSAGLKAETDYISSEIYFQEMKTLALNGDKEPALKAYDSLKTIISKHPDLKQKYNGELGQFLVLLNEPEKAEPYIAKSVKVLESRKLDAYATLSESALLIEKSDFKKAIEVEEKLKFSLNEVFKADFLKSYNLLQLAFLESLNPEAETKPHLLELSNAIESKDPNLMKIIEKFNLGEAKLADYLKEI